MSYEINPTLDSIFGVRSNMFEFEKTGMMEYEFEKFQIKSVNSIFCNHRHISLLIESNNQEDEK